MPERRGEQPVKQQGVAQIEIATCSVITLFPETQSDLCEKRSVPRQSNQSASSPEAFLAGGTAVRRALCADACGQCRAEGVLSLTLTLQAWGGQRGHPCWLRTTCS